MLSFESLDKRTWRDLQKLFGDKGACGGCWCMTWRLSHKEYEGNKGSKNKAKFHDLVNRGMPLGILAYEDDDPIGWCSVSPRKSLIRLETSRLFKRIDQQEPWSLTCLFIKKEYRLKGLSTRLIRAATNYAFEKGALVVEAYPIIPNKNKMPPVFAWVGFVNSFLKAGVKKIKQPSDSRMIMRLEK